LLHDPLAKGLVKAAMERIGLSAVSGGDESVVLKTDSRFSPKIMLRRQPDAGSGFRRGPGVGLSPRCRPMEAAD